MRISSAHLCAIGTAVPSHKVTQAEVAERTRRVFGLRMPEFDRLAPVFDNAGIDTRYSVRPSDWYEQDHDWADRTAVYHEAASALFLDAARIALARAGLTGADIDTVVTVSSTGIATPSLEARVATDLGLRPHVSRVPVFGLGCAGGVTGLSIAARLAESRPGSNVLLVAVELCSLAIRLDKLTKANIVALALFGDGAAAVIVRSARDGLLRIDAGAEHTWPDTLDIMGWSIDPQGFGVIFDRTIPPFAEAHLAAAIDAALGSNNLRRCDIDRFVCHPGGARVIEAIETALELPPGRLTHERAVLAQFGNMSAPTALFVLERVLAAGHPQRSLLVALGPGFTLSTLVLSQAGA